jgi:hypothetical protein
MADEVESVRVIDDDEFGRQLLLLRRTRRFLIEEGVSPSAANAASNETPFSLGSLNLISYIQRVFRRGRSPTLADWKLLEEKQARLQSYFTPELQHRFRLQATQRIITITPLLLLAVTLIALGLAIFPPISYGEKGDVSAWLFGGYLAWTSCLGGLGAISFLAVNSLAIQNRCDLRHFESKPRRDAHRLRRAVRLHRVVAILLPFLQRISRVGAFSRDRR